MTNKHNPDYETRIAIQELHTRAHKMHWAVTKSVTKERISSHLMAVDTEYVMTDNKGRVRGRIDLRTYV